jgi:hypothetical protein
MANRYFSFLDDNVDQSVQRLILSWFVVAIILIPLKLFQSFSSENVIL